MKTLSCVLLVLSVATGLRPCVKNRVRGAQVMMSGEERLEVAFIVGRGKSPYGETSPSPNPAWNQVATSLLERLNVFEPRIQGHVYFEDEEIAAEKHYDVAVGLGMQGVSKVSSTMFLVDETSTKEVKAQAFCGKYRPGNIFNELICELMPWSALASGRRVARQSTKLFGRHSAEDSVFAILLAMNAMITRIPIASSDINPSWEKGIVQNAKEFKKMADCCGSEIFAAISDPQTKKAIDLLTAVDLRDQVGSYRVIVSNETPQLEAFSLCILQQNNCFECDAPILDRPVVEPIKTWRGQPLNAESDRQIFIGHLDIQEAAVESKELYSWKIVCGANPAYDAFQGQHQIFYPSEQKGSTALWYDPVFCVETLEGELIWTKRHYRCVQRDNTPGKWLLTTLDNGLVSKEHWTIVDASDDLEWAIFAYSGAAQAAGQSYQGALLCTRDGHWPASAIDTSSPGYISIQAAFQQCGIQLFELYGHGPPSHDTDRSFMWTPSLLDFAKHNPPPLDRIGDISITSWRKRERARQLQEKQEDNLLASSS